MVPQVERLHADKHKLEDRLSSLEKAQFYEKSSSCWIREGGEEGEGGWEDTVMLDGMKGEKTESDIGVSTLSFSPSIFPSRPSFPPSPARPLLPILLFVTLSLPFSPRRVQNQRVQQFAVVLTHDVM